MDSNHEDGHSSTRGGQRGISRKNKGGSAGTSNSSSMHPHGAHDIMANLEASFQQQVTGSSGGNPLLERLNQNSEEWAHVAAVGHQLGPEGTIAPQVIGDYVGLNTRTGRNDSQELVQPEGDDDEFHELDAEYEDDEDLTLNFGRGLNLHGEDGPRASTSGMSAEAISAASAVDPRQLLGASGERSSVPWDVMAGFEPSMPDDDDELDENDPALEELGFALQPKSKRDKKKLSKKGAEPVYPPEIQALLGQANTAYITKDYKEAVELYQKVIVTHPSVFQAWNIMGVIQEELGNTEKALQLYLVAAHLTPKDGALWKKLAKISKNCGYNQQALYCYSRAYRADNNDMDALWDRSLMYHILGEPFKAIKGLQKLLKVRQHHMPALEELVNIYSSLDQDKKRYREYMHQAMVDYEAAYLHYSSLPERFANADEDPFDVTHEDDQAVIQNEPFGYSALNMLSELYIMFDEYEKPIHMIKTWSRRLQRRSHQTWWDDYKDDREFDTDPEDEDLQASLGDSRTRGLPVDLRVKLGICRLMMEEVKEAKAQFRYLWRCSVEDFPDLYEEIAELYINKQMWKEGHNVIRAMLQFDEMDIPKNWIMAGECLRNLGQLKGAKDYLEQAHRADPSSVDLSMMLAEVYEEMGNLPQALAMVNYVREAHNQKQAENEKKRKDARLARQMKLGISQSQSAQSDPTPADLEGVQIHDGRFRSIAPRPRPGTTSTFYVGPDAAKSALERISEAGRSKAAAERYASADRDRDVQLIKSVREQERADKLAENELEQRSMIERFNRLDLIYQRIDDKEKSRVWPNKREAVKATREDRTQYIQAARELITIFRSNRGFFAKDKLKPYMGVERKAWTYRRSTVDADMVLSEHASEMAERLARAMGTAPTKQAGQEETADTGPVRAPPDSYKEVSFDAWYLLMIRQAVYLTYEDRYSEAAELLMVMLSANVNYSNARRRSGIMLVLLACAMWANDHVAAINTGRWLTHFGGMRPFAFKIFQATFTTGPRGHQEHFVWSQNITHKFLRRNMERMRKAIGKGAQPQMRRMLQVRRKNQYKNIRRGPNKYFRVLAPTLASPKKRPKIDAQGVPSKPVSFPWRTRGDVLVATTPVAQVDEDGTESAEPSPTGGPSAPESASQEGEASKEISPKSLRTPRTKVSFAAKPESSSSHAELRADDQESGSSVQTRIKKRQLEEDDTAGPGDAEVGEDIEADVEEDEEDGDDDDDDINDELYRSEDEEGKSDGDDDGETEWENDDPRFAGPRSKVFGKSSGRILNGDEDEDDFDDDVGVGMSSSQKSSRRYGSSKGQKERLGKETEPPRKKPSTGGADYESKRIRTFTEERYTQFHVHMVMFLGHVLAASRSHVGSATQFAECMDHFPLNPMIQFYLAVQVFNLSMQRTTKNRQIAVAQGLVFLQNYYRLRSAGYGSLAFAKREKENKAKGKTPQVPPIEPVISIVGVGNKATKGLQDQAAKVSEEAHALTSTAELTASHAGLASASTAATEPITGKPRVSSQSSAAISDPSPWSTSTASSPSASASQDPPLKQCQQEAEYNLARAFHQLGQNHLALIHYRRVLELPSWREVEREQRAERKIQRDRERIARKEARAEARALALERKLKRVQELRELKDAGRVKKTGASGDEEDEDEDEDYEEEDEEMEEDELESSDSDDDDDDDERPKGQLGADGQELSGSDYVGPGRLPRMKLEDDDDPTDLSREAAFNSAKIYMQSGAMGEAQLLMHKYCTL